MPTIIDDYRDRQLEKYLDSRDYDCSDCCGAEVIEEDDEYHELENFKCSKCSEYCGVIAIGEFNYSKYMSAMEDKADAMRADKG